MVDVFVFVERHNNIITSTIDDDLLDLAEILKTTLLAGQREPALPFVGKLHFDFSVKFNLRSLGRFRILHRIWYQN